MQSPEALGLSTEPLADCLLTAEQKHRLADLLDRYLSSLESGIPLDCERLVEENSDLADQLRIYLASLDQLHGAAAQLGCREPAVPAAPRVQASDARRLGDFEIRHEIGRGGMGVVYEAHQVSLDRRVALKVLPFAAVLDPKQISRFKSEAQAAAQILHPNIVPVFAVGVDRGVHYYAMQLIDGKPLDQAITELRTSRHTAPGHPLRFSEGQVRIDGDGRWSTPIDARPREQDSVLSSGDPSSPTYFKNVAELGVQAARALHAAHEYGIVHRDVKPSNLLLDRTGKLWVTDFGLARCQSDNTFSKTGDIIGTMRYMSPEQAAGTTSLIDQRTDVYSLGVTLYELLTLKPAVNGSDGANLLRKIDEQQPERPRRLNPQLPVALENVVLKSIARAREDRYTTACELAEDLQRFLDGKPTVAKPPTTFERTAKWAARHKHLVTAAIALVSLVCVGLAVSTLLIARENSRAERNYLQAEQSRREAQEAVDLGAAFAEQLAGVSGAAHVRKAMLRETLAYYQRFAAQAAEDPALQADLALTHSKIGTLTDDMGAPLEAVAAHQEAINLFQSLVADEPQKATHQANLALCHNNLGLTLRRAGQIEEAAAAYRTAIELQTELVRRYPTDRYLNELATSYANIGLLLSESSSNKDAERWLRKAIEVHRQLLAGSSDDAQRHHQLGVAHNNLSAVYLDSDEAAAEGCYVAALRHLRAALATDPANVDYAGDLASTYNNIGVLHSRRQQHSAAAAAHQEAIRLRQALVAADPAHFGHRNGLAVSLNNYGLTKSHLGQPESAEHAFRKALAIQQTLSESNANDISLRSSLGGIYNNLGIVLEGQGRFAAAAAAYRDAITHQRFAHQRVPSVSKYRHFLSKHYFNLGRVYRELEEPGKAIQVALQRSQLWSEESARLFSVAEELALAAPLLSDSESTVSQVVETIQRAVAVGGHFSRELASRQAFAAIQSDERFARLVAREEERKPL